MQAAQRLDSWIRGNSIQNKIVLGGVQVNTLAVGKLLATLACLDDTNFRVFETRTRAAAKLPLFAFREDHRRARRIWWPLV